MLGKTSEWTWWKVSKTTQDGALSSESLGRIRAARACVVPVRSFSAFSRTNIETFVPLNTFYSTCLCHLLVPVLYLPFYLKILDRGFELLIMFQFLIPSLKIILLFCFCLCQFVTFNNRCGNLINAINFYFRQNKTPTVPFINKETSVQMAELISRTAFKKVITLPQ